MFNNYAMYDYEIIESAEEVCSGKLVLSLDDLHFLLDNIVREAMNKKAEDRLVFGRRNMKMLMEWAQDCIAMLEGNRSL